MGSAVPVGRAEQVLSVGDTSNPANLALDDYRAVEVFPPKGSSNDKIFSNTWFEDDGVSPPPVRVSTFKLNYSTTNDTVQVEFSPELEMGFKPHWSELNIILPAGDGRSVTLNGEQLAMDIMDAKGRARWRRPGQSGKGRVEERSRM